MVTVHIVPNVSAGVGVRTALAEAGAKGVVLVNNDDFSWGPIDPAALSQRRRRVPAAVSTEDLWSYLDAASDPRPIIWVGRGSAQEMSFYLYFAARYGDRSWYVVDVTKSRSPADSANTNSNVAAETSHGTAENLEPAKSVAELHPARVRPLLNSGQPVNKRECAELAERWRTLQSGNAPLRVITDAGLVSAPADYFDRSLLEQIPATPTPMARVIAETMGSQPYPVADYLLHRRLRAMIDAGRITAEGDPSVMANCRISASQQ
ncbi:DUF3658 domain-containing protein [Nocardia nova]|uniref:DUF3658 domain-containing protein n=1 Tax=Nocardia nova TaxID=37330 RepID=UPI003791B76E